MTNQQPALRRTGNQVARDAQRATVELTRQFQQEVDQFGPNIAQALPHHVPLAKFKRVLITAVAMNPDLLQADRRTLYLAAIKCAADGLLPDGRQAALVAFNTQVTMRDPQTGLDNKFRIDAVQYMPMIAGIRERMRNTGEVSSADAHAVYKNDAFSYDLGDNAFIKHSPPPLDQDRGELIGAYAIIRLKSGEIIRDVMSKKDIEDRRKHSRAPDSLMWTKFYSEGARKSVLRRAAKSAPQASEMERLFERDDEALDVADLPAGLPAPEAEPEPQRDSVPDDDKDEDEAPYCVVDGDGEVFQFHDAKTAAAALRHALAAAKDRGPDFFKGAIETNRAAVDMLARAGEHIEIEKEASGAEAQPGGSAAPTPSEPPRWSDGPRSPLRGGDWPAWTAWAVAQLKALDALEEKQAFVAAFPQEFQMMRNIRSSDWAKIVALVPVVVA